MSDDADFDEPPPSGPDDRDRDTIVEMVVGLDATLKRPSAPLEFEDGLRWAPDLLDDTNVVHVELGDHIPRAFIRRLRAARASGKRVVIVARAEVLTSETLAILQELEAAPYELRVDEDLGWQMSRWTSVADWVARANMALRPSELRRLVEGALAVAEDPNRTNHVRGHAFEDVLCLVFSQVSWLRVVDHAYNNASEEIDIVLQVMGAGEYAQLAGGPLAIATVKNEKRSLGSATIKYLEGQMGNRRGRCKLGFACARGEISKPANLELVGLRRSDIVIVPIGGDRLQELLDDADRLDERLAEMVIAATLS